MVELKKELALSGCQNEEYVEYDDMVVFRRLLEYLGAYGVDDLVIGQIAKIYRSSATQRISIYLDVEYTLAVLKKVGYNLAILSNAQRVYVEEDIGNLFKYFDHIYISSEHGIKKPSTRFYQKLLNEAQVKPEEAVSCCQLYDPACFECFQHPFISYEVDMPFTAYAMTDIVILAVFLWESQKKGIEPVSDNS